MKHHVFLIPGFFGFAEVGELRYFTHVRPYLASAFAERGLDADVHYAVPPPTASLVGRARRVYERVRETAGPSDAVHLIGHSTGGLDARLLVAEGFQATTGAQREAASPRIQSVITVATPHHGTPAAGFLTSVMGERFLQLLSLSTIYAVRLGSVPLPAFVALAGALPGTRIPGFSHGLVDQIYRQLLKGFSTERRHQIEEYVSQIGEDQALLPQLAPEAMELLNAIYTPVPGVRHGCVVVQARPPSLRGTLAMGLHPANHSMYVLYRGLHLLTGTFDPRSGPRLSPTQRTALTRAYGAEPDAEANDSLVPTLSQVWGDVVHATWADHMDVLGHFHAPGPTPDHVDWLRTVSGFALPEFEGLWSDVADFVCGAGRDTRM